MKVVLLERRTVWWPTAWGWACFALMPFAFAFLWWWGAERFLSGSRPSEGASVLIVEGWIGLEGLEAAKREFERGGYAVLVASGGMTTSRWALTRASYAEMAQREFVRLGVPEAQILVARSRADDNRRTYGMALAVKAALAERKLTPRAVNLFTLGAHARRSRLVYAKVLGPATSVGCLAWLPAEERGLNWWDSSERSKDVINETAGFLFEFLANSGRWMSR